jgi:hypothetical protein
MKSGQVCEAILVNFHRARKGGDVCGDPAEREFNGRPCCWLHYQIAVDGSRTLRFVGEPIPEFRSAAGAR